MVGTRRKIKTFRRMIELVVVLSLLMGLGGSSMAGCIGCESCKSMGKIARCTVYATEEAFQCITNTVTGKPTGGGCLGPICTAAWDGCCACMKYQAACNYAKTLDGMSQQECAKAIAIWMTSHSPK